MAGADPLLLRGDIEYHLARILRTRLDGMSGDEEVVHYWLGVIVE